ncbi:MAG: right-handed parallel beta-helix repeat-containing protein [Acidobacteria bacterium]|nr:right-handed parallel beta-helix repeat-containing protein [Acidobacteriota bacterium]
MKKSLQKLELTRRIVGLFVFLAISVIGLFAWQRTAELQMRSDSNRDDVSQTSKNESPDEPVSIRAAGRGNPYVNFKDGFDLASDGTAAADNSPAEALASADFDADGINDLVVADANGGLQFYKGRDSRKGVSQPFEPAKRSAALDFAPDFLAAGDFNADGRPDLVAAAGGANFLALLSGDGAGNFSAPQAIAVGGRITALSTGEIGRADGQTDLAVAYTDSKGAYLTVFEHPESAFRHKPEIFKLPAPATALAIGDLDGDFYADVAVGCGPDLTIVHGRGQAYPWDLLPDSGIKRPKAAVAARRMPFSIAALTFGRFGGTRGDSLALLGTDGNLYRLAANRSERAPKHRLTGEQLARTAKNLSLPTGVDDRNLATIEAAGALTGETDAAGMPLIDRSAPNGENSLDYLRQKQQEAAKNFKKPDPQEIEAIIADGAQKRAAFTEKAKQAFIRSIAGRPASPAAWSLETLAAGARLTGAAVSNSANKMMRVNVSDSRLDDILLVDSTSNQIRLVTQAATEGRKAAAEIVDLDVAGGLRAVLPMRLNLDALSDLIVLRQGASNPSAVMTAPANVFIVTSTDETGDCQNSNPCSLRNAILLANSAPGMDIIAFNLGAGTHTITPSAELPVITDAVSLQGSSDANGNKLVEISGANIASPAADGLKVRTSNSFIYNLAVNQFPALPNQSGSLVGGNAVTIETTLNAPTNGNNFIVSNYLGTDPTGSFSKANKATGLNIFDSDQNYIDGNVMSGNDSRQTGGAGLSVTAGNSNSFYRNIIGLNALGTAKLGNITGVFLAGADNNFGGTNPNDGNTVSGNGIENLNYPGHCVGSGMLIPNLIDLQTNELIGLNNNVAGNRFGTNPAGTIALGNCSEAINTSPLTQTTIGAVTPAGRNIVADNGLGAIVCSEEFLPDFEGGFCAIAGNNIGTDITGNIAMPNNDRNLEGGFDRVRGNVDIFHNLTYSYFGAPGGTTPGGACTGLCNLYSANNPGIKEDIYFTGRGTIGFFNNYIGTNAQGNQALPNNEGINLGNVVFGQVLVGAAGRDENNAPVALGNLISGNLHRPMGAGTFSSDFPGAGYFSTVSLYGNRVGTDATGTFAIPNDADNQSIFGSGINLSRGFTETNIVGGTDPLERNIISGNAGNGLSIRPAFGGQSFPLSTKIVNNLIGLNSSLGPLGNGGNGIEIQDGSGAEIGGTDQEANQIAYNGIRVSTAAGVLIDGFPGVFNQSRRITVRNNSIHDNAGLGIDLNSSFAGLNGGGDGVTANDCQDADDGANELQNFPELLAPVQNGDGSITVAGMLSSKPGRAFVIDFYSSPAADQSSYGEGANYIGSVNISTDGNGFSEFEYRSALPVPANLAITATATDADGNTSEFSCAAGQCSGARTNFGDIRNGAPLCSGEIIVNVTGDESDDVDDGFCDVNPNEPMQQCTLRAAIQEAERRPGRDRIKFEIEPRGEQTISLTGPLPQITSPVWINGLSQSPSYVGPLITVDGTGAGTGASGLKLINASSAEIDGLEFTNFASNGILISGGSNNEVTDCIFEGTGSPMETGVKLVNSSGNKIGDRLSRGNKFFNNNNNILLENANGNQISGNYVFAGLNGISLISSSNNEIGVSNRIPTTSDDNPGNTIVNVALNAVYLSDVAPPTQGNFRSFFRQTSGELNKNSTDFEDRLAEITESVRKRAAAGAAVIPDEPFVFSADQEAGTPSRNNTIVSNQIGSLDDVVTNYENGRGIFVGNAVLTKIGKDGNAERNYITKSRTEGIFVSAASQTTIVNHNFIGVSLSGEAPRPNVDGIAILSNRNTISRNLISGNTHYGVVVGTIGAGSGGANENTFLHNFIGTNLTATVGLPNELGIYINGNKNFIGDSMPTGANVIAGNHLEGILFEIGAAENRVMGNLIGAASGTTIPNQTGILLRGSKNDIFKNVISGNQKEGVKVEYAASNPSGPQENKIRQNFIGTDSEDAQLPNETGIFLTNGAWKNLIEDNVISGNTEDGVKIGAKSNTDAVSKENVLWSNRIGTTGNGDFPLPNRNGVRLVNAASDNCIGPDDPAAPTFLQNVISGNSENGILIARNNVVSGGDAPTGNKIRINRIGLGASPDLAVPNNVGINLGEGATGTIIGGRRQLDGNVISGNTEDGVRIAADYASFVHPSGNRILGNLIGVQRENELETAPAVGNGRNGILIQHSDHNIIGELENATEEPSDYGNVIGGNQRDGIRLDGAHSPFSPTLTRYNEIKGNYIGVSTGGVKFANLDYGINAVSTLRTIVSGNITSGGAKKGLQFIDTEQIFFGPRNTAPGTPSGGADLRSIVSGNLIGVARNENGELIAAGNDEGGIGLIDSSDILIGNTGTGPIIEKPNIIAANGGPGILIRNGASNIIAGAFIGTDQTGATNLGNAGDGVLLSDQSGSNQIGSDSPNSGNTISFNGGAGVRIDETAGSGNLVDPNSIFGNTGLGIDLGSPGHTPNDPDDADTGPNNLQNYPTIVSKQIVGGELFVEFQVDSAPEYSNYGANGLYVEFFNADAQGQGERFLGSTYYTLGDHDGALVGTKTVDLGNAGVLGINANDPITATVTDADGNTSEFAPIFVPTAAGVALGGEVTGPMGQGIANVRVTLTDANGAARTVLTNNFGRYRFESVPAGAVYTVGVSNKKYRFEPPTQVVELTDARDDLNFTAAP